MLSTQDTTKSKNLFDPVRLRPAGRLIPAAKHRAIGS
jgi:hypothetical protein